MKKQKVLMIMSLAMTSLLGFQAAHTIAQQFTNEPGYDCISDPGILGCINCANGTPAGYGCSNPSLPAGFMFGTCESACRKCECSSGSLDCGAWYNCTSGLPNGNMCTTFAICN